MGVVYYSKYLEFFEAGRNDILKKIGYPYSKLEEKNYALPVIEVSCKYHNYARYDDLIKIKTIINDIPAVRFKLEYEITCDEKKIVTGYTVHSFVNMQKIKPVKPPEDFIVCLRKFI